MTSFKFVRSTVTEKRVSDESQSLPMYSGGELAPSFTEYPGVDFQEQTLYFKVGVAAFIKAKNEHQN